MSITANAAQKNNPSPNPIDYAPKLLIGNDEAYRLKLSERLFDLFMTASVYFLRRRRTAPIKPIPIRRAAELGSGTGAGVTEN